MPVACYLKKDAMAYITGSRIALHFRAAARAVRPNISKDDEQRYSAHSMRVWACVLLDEVGELPDYIKKRLRWMGNSFRMYLRDTHVIQDQHRKALRASSEEVTDLVSALPANILHLSIMSEETAGEEEDMGVYQDEMDKKSNPTQKNNLSILLHISYPNCLLFTFEELHVYHPECLMRLPDGFPGAIRLRSGRLLTSPSLCSPPPP